MLDIQTKNQVKEAIQNEVIAVDGKTPLSIANDEVTGAMFKTIKATKDLADAEDEADEQVDKELGVTAQKAWKDAYIRRAKTELKVAEKHERIALQDYNHRVKELDTSKYILSNN